MHPAKLATLVALVTVVVASPAASAHKTTYSADGNVKITWGFLNEPAITMTKTGLDLILLDNATGAPILGAEKTLKVGIRYGDDEHVIPALKPQFGAPGKYTDVITLTRPGIYALHLTGTINGTDVAMEIPAAHEVVAIDETYFPGMAPADARASDAKVAALEAKLAQLDAKVAALESTLKTSASTPATVAAQDPARSVPAVGTLGALAALAVVAVVAFRRR